MAIAKIMNVSKTTAVDLDNLLSLFHVPSLPFLDIEESPSDRDRYIEVNEEELESQYILPNLGMSCYDRASLPLVCYDC